MGKNGWGETNENGDRLPNFCNLNDLMIQKLIWGIPDGNVNNQKDHVLINSRWMHSFHDVKFRGMLMLAVTITFYKPGNYS